MVVTVPEVPSRCRPSRAAVLGGEAIDVDGDLGDHRLEHLAADRDAAVALGQRHDADRDRHPGLDLRMRRTVTGRRERPSRTSSDEPPPMSNRITPSAAGSTSGVQPVAASRASVSRSTISSSMPTSLRHALEEVEAVAGRAAGFGRDQPRAGDAAVAHLGAADAQRIDRAQDRRLAQPAGAGDALAQPDDARERVDHAEAVAGGARHQQPAVVGAEIERGIGRAGHVQPALPAAIARRGMPIRRPPAPPGPLRAPGQARGRGRSPGPRRPSKTFPHAEALSFAARLDGAAVISNFGAKCRQRRRSGATLGVRQNMARTAGCACETGLVRYLRPRPLFPS